MCTNHFKIFVCVYIYTEYICIFKYCNNLLEHTPLRVVTLA